MLQTTNSLQALANKVNSSKNPPGTANGDNRPGRVAASVLVTNQSQGAFGGMDIDDFQVDVPNPGAPKMRTE